MNVQEALKSVVSHIFNFAGKEAYLMSAMCNKTTHQSPLWNQPQVNKSHQ